MEHFWHTAHIGTHSLSYALRGIARQPGRPLVIILTGITSSALEWSAVCRDLESEASILLYERSGYGRSEESPNEPDSLTIVDEFSRLLAATALEPPYLVVGHSWGGMLAREFVAARPIEDVCGLVLVDSVQEHMQFETWPDPSIAAVTEGLDYMKVTGLTQDHRLTDIEWKELMAEEPGYILAEKQQLHPGCDLLRGKPVTVLRGSSKRDHELLYEAGVARGRGTETQRAIFREYLAQWEQSEDAFQREFLNLSTMARISMTARSGHNIQITEPGRVADEIRWVLQSIPGSSQF